MWLQKAAQHRESGKKLVESLKISVQLKMVYLYLQCTLVPVAVQASFSQKNFVTPADVEAKIKRLL